MIRRWPWPCLLLVSLWFVVHGKCRGDDWPGWRGPDRTGVSTETGLLKSWPKEGPKLLWKAVGMGEGYSTPSVAAGKVFLMGSKGKDEYVLALDSKDGQVLWSTRVGAVGENRGPNYPGPRSTPTVEENYLYTLGSDGDLVCVETSRGKTIWHKNLTREFAGNRGTWAYAESPLIDGDRLICTPGGPNATMLCLHKKTGAVIWKAVTPQGNQAGYASTIVVRGNGMKQYVQFLNTGVVGISSDGQFLWEYNRNLGGVSAATPIFHDGCIFTSAGGMGSAGGDALVRLMDNKPGIKEIYYTRVMMNFHGGVIRVGDFLYGANNQGLVCMAFKTGKKQWFDRSIGPGSLVAADGHLYLRSPDGTVALIEINPERYLEHGRFRQPLRTRFPAFPHPVVANGCLFLRDADVLLCYDIKDTGARRDSKRSDLREPRMITQEQASVFAKLALKAIEKEYPHKPGIVFNSIADVRGPRVLHPAFFGSFDWHSAVHGHWMLVRLMQTFPELPERQQIRTILAAHLTAENLKAETDSFAQPNRQSFERTYGWAWLLKLAEELHSSDDQQLRQCSRHLQPLTDAIVLRYLSFLPKQTYPIRSGVHPNTAFGLTFALDYARTVGHKSLCALVEERSRTYFGKDAGIPAQWEPDGADFFSPSLMEADLMRHILTTADFRQWLHQFLPDLARGQPKNLLTPVTVTDRTDPQLVHLDGLNLSRAWCMRHIAQTLPAGDPVRKILAESADRHADSALRHVTSGDYAGEHWLASFAVYLLTSSAGG
jgi:outer membrane protein assembly factor BamB